MEYPSKRPPDPVECGAEPAIGIEGIGDAAVRVVGNRFKGCHSIVTGPMSPDSGNGGGPPGPRRSPAGGPRTFSSAGNR